MPPTRDNSAADCQDRGRQIDAARLRALLDAAVDVTSALDLEVVLQKVVDAARDLIGARYAALGILRPHTATLERFLVSGISREEAAAIQVWPRGRGLLGVLLRDARPLRVRNIADDGRAVGVPANHPRMTSFLGAPIRLGESVVGSFYLADKLGAEEFSQEDEDLLVIFSAQVAVAVHNARRFGEADSRLSETLRLVQRAERRSRFLLELSAMFPVGASVRELPFAAVAERIVGLLGDACAIIILDPQDGERRLVDLTYHVDPARAESARRLLAAAWPTLRSLTSQDTPVPYVVSAAEPPTQEAPFIARRLRDEQFTAIAALPIRTNRGVRGLLAVVTSQSQSIPADDVDFAGLVADRLGLALENATLVHDLQAALEARDEFISIATHELKTPVTTIKGYAQLLARRDGAWGQRERQALDAIRKQAERLAYLTNELLDVARLRARRLALRSERCDLVALCREAVDRFALQLGDGDPHRLRLEAPTEALWGEWDPSRLDQVLTNLLSNAVKYSPQGGDVTVRVRRHGNEALVSVADGGIGIPDDERDHIFDTFHRGRNAPPRVEGAGLGLHIAKEIVERHGGRMWFTSREGVGSTFSFSLPLAPP